MSTLQQTLADLPPLGNYLQNPVMPSYATTKHMARKNTLPTPPSFRQKLDEAVRKNKYLEEVLGITPFHKLVRRRNWLNSYLQEQGFQTPSIYHYDFPLQALAENVHNHQDFVIKPCHATNAWGVMLLERRGERRFFNFLDSKEYSLHELLVTLNEPMQHYMFPNSWMVEELLYPVDGSSLPLDDYKCYAFKGQIPLILQVNRKNNRREYKWYDSEWTEIRTGKYDDAINSNLQPPSHPVTLLETAMTVSRKLPIPFCRIDLYDTEKGTVVGELTPEPGMYQSFSSIIDQYLGVYFEIAELQNH